ncbi:MAG: HEAT repeat domain-containing protein, partial [Bacteroidales bacterium]
DEFRMESADVLGGWEIAEEDIVPVFLDILKDTEDSDAVRLAVVHAARRIGGAAEDIAPELAKEDVSPVLLDILKDGIRPADSRRQRRLHIFWSLCQCKNDAYPSGADK